MKLLSLNHSEVTLPGGVHTAILKLSKALIQTGYTPTILSVNPGGLQSEDCIDGELIIRMRSPISWHLHGFSPSTLFRLTKYVNRIQPDIIHVHGYHTLFSLEVLYLLRNSGYPIVFSPHYGPESHNTLLGDKLWGAYKHVGKSCFQIADKVICASEFERANVLRDFQVDAGKIEVIPHGVDAIKRKKTRTAKCGISLLYVGWFIELKGIQFILKALSELNTALDANATLILVGKGGCQEQLMKLARELNVADVVFWYAPLFGDALYRKIREADILLLLSRSENFGIVVAEALAAGVPCIVAHKAALKEFSGEPGCFSIAYPPQTKELARLIVKVYEGDVEVGPFSNRIQTWDKIALRYDELYRSLLKGDMKRAHT
ncbi:MAG: glycosyltransferase family 4 protein [Halobacteriota archaeon]|jgi:glycosyltransferase involved in cell wall biosynthesis